jgi:hypothetical protein
VKKINEIIPCTVIKWPDAVAVEVWEKGRLKNRKVATTFVAIPGHHTLGHEDIKNTQV